MNRGRVWAGVMLVSLGLALLFREWLSTPLLMGMGLIFLGTLGLKKRLSLQPQVSVFGPLLVLLIGIYCILGPILLPTFNGRTHLAFFPMLLGVALMITAIFRKWRVDLLIIGFTVSVIGIVFILRYFNIIFSYHMIYLIDTFWPVLLILSGIALIFNALLHRHSV